MATDTNTSLRHGILSEESGEDREQLVQMLTKAYWMEIETVMSYIANSINPDGVRAQEIIESLETDIQEELGHARRFGERIKELYGVVPGSLDFHAEQSYLQPPDDQVDIVHVIKGVIEAETGAIEFYNQIIEFAAEQSYLQTPEHQTDIVHVIKGVIEAEKGAIEHYTRVVDETDGVDPVTNDMVIAILRDEQGHRRLFEGYLREYEAEGLA